MGRHCEYRTAAEHGLWIQISFPEKKQLEMWNSRTLSRRTRFESWAETPPCPRAVNATYNEGGETLYVGSKLFSSRPQRAQMAFAIIAVDGV